MIPSHSGQPKTTLYRAGRFTEPLGSLVHKAPCILLGTPLQLSGSYGQRFHTTLDLSQDASSAVHGRTDAYMWVYLDWKPKTPRFGPWAELTPRESTIYAPAAQ